MTEYYKEKLQEGLEFQDFIAVQFSKIGLLVTPFSSKKYQYEVGESLQGYEFKNDQAFRKTKNLYIEIAEKSNPNNRSYIDSGILRADNTIFYVIGDVLGVYLIQKKVLIAMYKKGSYRKIENNMKTSIGFLLPCKDAEIYFNYISFSP
jgi:hypothetical protein